MARRRALAFDSLIEVMPEVDRLLAGYSAARRWSLGQGCITCPRCSDARSRAGRSSSLAAPSNDRTDSSAGEVLRRRDSCGRVNRPQPESGMIPRPDLDDRAEAEALRGAIRYYQGYTDALPNILCSAR